MTDRSPVLAEVAPEPGVAKPDPVLVIEGLRKYFGGVRAVDVDRLEIQRNTVTSLIGPNGAGKTTLFNLLTGFEHPDAGSWLLDGGLLVGIPAFRVARLGMVRTFQLTRALRRLTVRENVMLAAKYHPGESMLRALFGRWRDREREVAARADELLKRFDLEHMADEYAGTLSGGQRKLLELARTLMVEPEVVLLDEPTAGINPALTQALLTHITALQREGRTVVFIEHDMDVVREISDWVVVMSQGKVIAEDRPQGIAGNPLVIDAYLGTKHGETAG